MKQTNSKEKEEDERTLVDYVPTFTPFSDYILKITANNIWILNEEDDVVIETSQMEFERICRLWLDTKRDYCLRYGYPCGSFGNFTAKKGSFERQKERDITWGDNTYNHFFVLKFEDHCDMEHG